MSLFEVLAHTDDTAQANITGNRAVIAAQSRVQDRFSSFVANAAGPEDRDARLSLLDDEIRDVVSAVCEEYQFEDTDFVHAAALQALGAGHLSSCSCGFCANKGKLPGAKDDDKDSDSDSDEKDDDKDKDDKKDSKKPWEKDSADDFPGKDYSIENGEYVKDWSPEEDQEAAPSKDESNKGAWHDAKIASYSVSMFHEADGFSFCECKCDGCKTSNHCESDQCISTKHSGNPGNSSGETTSKVAAGVETGDTFVTEKLDLGDSSGKNGIQDVGSPKIDKSQVPGGGGIPGEDGLAAIEVPSKQHPLEQQDIHKTPDYWEAPGGPSETGKAIDADTALQPEFNAAPDTQTWTGTEGQASPVTSKLAKWQILT